MHPRVILISLILCPVIGLAQVGVGTTTTDASARFQIDASSGTNDNPKGFLPPRVALAATSSIAPFSTITPATGLLVYNTATAGSGSSAVTPGFYYYDGAKWQRIISQQPDATVSFNTTNPNPPNTPNFTPNSPASTDFIYVGSDGSQWTYNGSAYVTYTPPASTPWLLSAGTNDAGSNKTGAIYRSGKVGVGGGNTPNATLDVRTNPTSTTDPGAGHLGIGTSSAAANTAGAGAVRYSTTSGGVIQYSNGTAWNTLSSNVQKSLVSGYLNATTYAAGYFGDLSATEVLDVNNDFSSNTFTAPRTGNYTFTVTASSNSVNGASAGGFWELQVSPSSGSKMVSRYQVPSTVANNYVATVTGAYTVQLTAGTTVTFKLYNSLGFSKTLDAEDYNRFSIVEN
jgi:hypothetical protein